MKATQGVPGTSNNWQDQEMAPSGPADRCDGIAGVREEPPAFQGIISFYERRDRMKKVLSILLLVALCIAMLPVTAMAEPTAKVYVSSTGKGTLNLRKGPSKSSKVVGYVKHNATVTLTGDKSGEWSKIKSGSKTGWIKTIYIDGTTKEWGTGYKSLKLTGSQTVAMRKKPGTKYKKVGLCSAGDSVKVLYTEDGWADVTNMTTGKTGWIPQSYLGPTATVSSAKADPPPASAAKVYHTTASTLRMRKGPSTKYKVIAKLPHGTAFTVLDKDGNWYKIKTLKGKVGWVYKAYTAETATLKTTAYWLNLRKGPSTSTKILGTLKKGTWVKVHKITGNWAYVTVGSKKGYVSLNYLAK